MSRRRLFTLAGCTLALVAAGCATAIARDDAGAIVERGALSVFSMRVGDCFDDPDSLVAGELLELGEVPGVPCDEPHDSEVFAVFELPDDEDSPYPGGNAIYSIGLEQCLSHFQGYVGIAYEDSRLELDPFTPTAESWNENDDRELVCFLYDLALAPLTGSMRTSFE